MEGVCEHFPFGTGGGICSICKHGVTEAKSAKPDNWWHEASRGYKTDPGDVFLEGMLADVVCPRCGTSRIPIGCSCNRAKVFAEDMRQASNFCLTAPSQAVELAMEFSDTEATHVGLSAFKRASRRVDWESEDELRDARQGLAEELGVEPLKANWHPPRNVEPTHLPV